jgi:hypothetical protein
VTSFALRWIEQGGLGGLGGGGGDCWLFGACAAVPVDIMRKVTRAVVPPSHDEGQDGGGLGSTTLLCNLVDSWA